MTALSVVVLLAVGSFGFLYTTHSFGVFPATTTTTSSGTSTTKTNGTYALINTSQGTIEVQLFPASAPKTVANFVSLARSGFYNNLIWHRIVPGFVVQTGDSKTRNDVGGANRSLWGQGTSGTSVPFENDPTLHNSIGYVAMASTGAGVGGSSQFYINLVDNSASLDGKYAVFGKVINGMSVVQALGGVSTNSNQQPTDASKALMVSVTIQNSP